MQVVTPGDVNVISTSSAYCHIYNMWWLDRVSPNMLTYSPPPAVICAENIALLYLLHSVPVPPSCNEIKKPPSRQGGYSSSFVQERDLASTLAFLSYTEDDPNHIPALCVEENPKLMSLDVVVAVNKKNEADGNEALQNIEQNLEKIFTILSEISQGM
ncbi:hypothetical protein ACJQWK_02578 [Exserohilum turcicum]